MLKPELRLHYALAGPYRSRVESVIMLRSDLRFSEIQRKLPRATWSRSPRN